MEHLFGGNITESLEEMIERDIIQGYHDLSNDDLLVNELDITFSGPSATSLALTNVSTEGSLYNKTLDNSIIFSNGNNISLSELQNGNNYPNLLVNPQTGLPVTNHELQRQTISHSQPIEIAVTQNEAEADSEMLESPDVDMLSPTGNEVQYLAADNIPASPITPHSAVHSSQYVDSPQHSPIHVQNAQHTFDTFHQTLTQHLLSNNNHHKLLHKDPSEKVFPKPVYSYSCLIAMALKNSETGALPVSEIYSFMTENFPYFKTAPDGWKNSVRHNLSLNKCFEKIENPRSNGNTRKGCLWGLNPNKIEKMEEEIVKWRKKDPAAVKRSMSKPEKLEELERGNIGSHAPLPPGLKALRELQLLKLNNAHSGNGTPTSNGSNHSNGSQLGAGSIMFNSNGRLSFTPAAKQQKTTEISPTTVTMVTPIYTDNQQTAVSQTVVARTLAQRLINGNVIAKTSVAQAASPAVSEAPSSGGIQVTMLEITPKNKVQQIKTEDTSESNADSKPIVINLCNEPVMKTEVKMENGNEVKVEGGEELGLDPTLSDFALQHWDELANDGINLEDLPSLNLSFSTSPSPAGVQVVQQNGTSSPLIGLLQANGGTLSGRTISAFT